MFLLEFNLADGIADIIVTCRSGLLLTAYRDQGNRRQISEARSLHDVFMSI